MATVNDFLRIPITLLSTIGISTVQRANGEHQFSVRIFYYIGMFNLVACVVGEMIYFVRGITTGTAEFIRMTFLVLCIGFIWIGIVKITALAKNTDTVNELISELCAYFPYKRDEQCDYLVGVHAKKAKIIMLTYASVQMFMIWCFNLFPLAETIYAYWRDRVWSIDFSYTIWYPIDPYQRWIFEIFYASQYWAAHASAMYILCADILLCSLGEQVYMHFEQLTRKFSSFSTRSMPLIEQMEVIEQSVKKHNIIIK